jgi:CRP/FNR family transcriptional regulator, cyclic AMP receptor protein
MIWTSTDQVFGSARCPRSTGCRAPMTRFAHLSSLLPQVAPADLEELLAAHPALSRSLLRLEALRLRLLLTAIESYSVQSLEQRLSSRLLMLAVSYGVKDSQGLKIKLRLSQEMLAQLIGATRQRINQIFKKWEAEGGVQQQYGDITLLDRDRLEKLARV